LAVFVSNQSPSSGSGPHGSIGCHDQLIDLIDLEFRRIGPVKYLEFGAIVANQTLLRTQPHEAILILNHGSNRILGQAFIRGPDRVPVLGNRHRWVEIHRRRILSQHVALHADSNHQQARNQAGSVWK